MAKARGNLPGRMTVDEFLVWLDDQPERPRYELVDGVAVAMAPERAAHARLKARIWRELDGDIGRRGLPCEAFPDGMGVRVDDSSLYEPDVVVRCGDRIDGDTVLVPEPVILVEVLSPGTKHIDTSRKLEGYFRISSVVHCLIVPTEQRTIIHHRRADDGTIETRIVMDGVLDLDPPGIGLDLEHLYV
jgi:Uma2 family endonuclease